MNKNEILAEIKRLTKESDGKAPGTQRFSNETGMKKSDWYPNLWLRWGDAIIEAGCQPNEFNSAYDKKHLIKKYIELIRELGHFPIEGELRNKNENDKTFPSHSGFAKLGNKQERAKEIRSYCEKLPEYSDIVELCTNVIKPENETTDVHDKNKTIGYVYLIQHGSRNEYKIGRTNNPIRREGEIKLELPEKIKPIHYIETDDPAGIENYWHRRFSNKRKEGEWFSLIAEDIRAFKKWRKIN